MLSSSGSHMASGVPEIQHGVLVKTNRCILFLDSKRKTLLFKIYFNFMENEVKIILSHMDY